MKKLWMLTSVMGFMLAGYNVNASASAANTAMRCSAATPQFTTEIGLAGCKITMITVS